MNFTFDKLDNPENRDDFYLVSIFATIMFSFSCIGALYVMYRTFKQWIYWDETLMKYKKRSLSMNFKLPFYTSCIDLIDNSFSLANILYTAVHAEVLEEPTCKVISAILWAFATLNLSLYLAIAFATYFRICHEYKKFFKFGKYDYKLWFSVIIFSATFQLINMYNHGARKYWCSGRSGQINSSITIFCLIIFTLIIILCCYIKILLKLNLSSNIENISHKKAAKKIISYILIFIIHWIPIIIQNLGRFLKVEHPWLYILKSSGHAMGSIGNAVVYIINEGVVTRPVSNILNDNNKHNNEVNDVTIDFNRVSLTLQSLNDKIENLYKDY